MDTKHKPNAIGIPEKRTSNVKTATIIAIIRGSINLNHPPLLILLFQLHIGVSLIKLQSS